MNHRTAHPLLATIAVAACLSLTTLALTGCGEADAQAEAPQMPPAPVAVATALRQAYAPTLELTGHFEASQQVEVRPQTDGRVLEVLVDDGAIVSEGQVLVRIEDAPLKAAVAQAKAMLQRAEARLLIAQQREGRNRPLVATEIVEESLLDEIEADIATAQADIAAAKATIEANEIELGYATVRAPIAGRIGRVLVAAGDTVQGGGGGGDGSDLLTIVANDTIDVIADLPEQHYLTHAQRLHAALADPSLVPMFVELGTGGDALNAQLHMIDNQTAPGSGVVRLFLRLTNPDGHLIPGVFTRVRMQLEPEQDMLMVHEHAVQSHMTGRFVYTVDSDGITAMTPVQLGARVGNLRVVNAGLTGNELIAMTNVRKIFYTGMPVAPLPGDMATASPLAESTPQAGTETDIEMEIESGTQTDAGEAGEGQAP